MSRLLRAVLVRRDLFIHIQARFPRMEQHLASYGSEDWYKKTFQISKDFVANSSAVVAEDSDDESMPLDAPEPDSAMCST